MPPPPGRSAGYPLQVAIDAGAVRLTLLAMVLLSMLASAWVARKTVHKPIVDALGPCLNHEERDHERPFIAALALLCAALAAAAAQAHGRRHRRCSRPPTATAWAATTCRSTPRSACFNADGTPDKERRYTVFAQAQHQSLVLMQSPAETGQKVLMLGDDFWLLMPGSQRPLRITPMQKLLGDASTGDIATMSWADDYTGSVVGEEPCGEPAQTCQHLSLQAARKGVTYQRIELWLGKARHEPVRADLYVQSDKLAKQARFVMDKPAAPTLVTEMVLLDQLEQPQGNARALPVAARQGGARGLAEPDVPGAQPVAGMNRGRATVDGAASARLRCGSRCSRHPRWRPSWRAAAS